MTDRRDSEGNESALTFPCDFPIKIMGRDSDAFRTAAVAIVERHTGKLPADAVRASRSRKANFVSLTITINAQNQDQLDAIYRELTGHEEVLVAL